MSTTATSPPESRTVPLEQIDVVEGFNPRRSFDEAELDRLARSLAETGMLHPLIVYAAGEDRYELGDGERRYRAAQRAGITEVPVIVRPRHEGGHELVEALTVNLHREAHTPIEEAQAFRRLLDCGLTRKGICERLSVTRERVRERLALLELPEDLHGGIDDGSVPLHAVRTLLDLGAMHPELPLVAARRVGAEPRHSWGEPITWAEVVEDPLGVITPRYHDEEPELPAGVYDADWTYPVTAFTLSEQATKDQSTLESGHGMAVADIRFDAPAIAQAESLGALHSSPEGCSRIVVGQDVADQLAGDVLRRMLKTARAEARAEKQRRDEQGASVGASGESTTEAGKDTGEDERERRRAEREAEMERRAAAERHNDELGAAVYKTLGTVKPDARALKILAAVDFTPTEVDGLAALGMRYGYPGWVTEEPGRGERTKRVYLAGSELAAKVREYLDGADSAQAIVGRCLSIVVMAVLADEDCVARSNRAAHSLHPYRPSFGGDGERGLPWQHETLTLVEDLALERLPDALTGPLRERRAEAERQAVEAQEAERAAQADDEKLRSALGGMDPEQRLAELRAFQELHGHWTPRARELQAHVLHLNAGDAESNDDAGEESSGTSDDMRESDRAVEPGPAA